ncbi:MAG: GIY-YIG nuclease family protein [Deltaproteobacteria bacterium]|nr:GIY-YIG nuclease family protein [Deltaproteobacteria bacterium]MBN2671212.1 GIY-YIG nuclease family protein [Deltaproteobacteria bacterium]
MSDWYLYIVRCEDDYLYTGVTTQPDRRFREHVSQKKGAAFFRAHTPVEMRIVEQHDNRSDVQKREAIVKKMSKLQKQQLFTAGTPINPPESFGISAT